MRKVKQSRIDAPPLSLKMTDASRRRIEPSIVARTQRPLQPQHNNHNNEKKNDYDDRRLQPQRQTTVHNSAPCATPWRAASSRHSVASRGARGPPADRLGDRRQRKSRYIEECRATAWLHTYAYKENRKHTQIHRRTKEPNTGPRRAGCSHDALRLLALWRQTRSTNEITTGHWIACSALTAAVEAAYTW